MFFHMFQICMCRSFDPFATLSILAHTIMLGQKEPQCWQFKHEIGYNVIQKGIYNVSNIPVKFTRMNTYRLGNKMSQTSQVNECLSFNPD